MDGDGGRQINTCHRELKLMNNRPILITISNYEEKEITYVIPQSATVDFYKSLSLDGLSSKMTQLSIDVSCEEGIKEFREKESGDN